MDVNIKNEKRYRNVDDNAVSKVFELVIITIVVVTIVINLIGNNSYIYMYVMCY
jgi:hypothetical protein